MAAWGFEYQTHFVWAKDRAGTGYWFRNEHELLLVGRAATFRRLRRARSGRA